jgi:hypothetical protein
MLVPTHNSLELFTPYDRGWRQYLSQVPHDFFHMPEYHELSLMHEAGMPYMAVMGSQQSFIAWPYLLLPIGNQGAERLEMYDVTSVYGYAGPVASVRATPQLIRDANIAFVDLWRSQKVVSVFTRFHPILGNVQWALDADTSENIGVQGGVLAQGRTVAIDLQRSLQDIEADYHRTVRVAIRRAQENQIYVVIDQKWTHFDEFFNLYTWTMVRKKAKTFYFFGEDHFQKLKSILGDKATIIAAFYGDVMISAVLLIEHEGIANYYLAAHDDRFDHLAPGKLLVPHLVRFAKARGSRYLHLGGGKGARDNDPLFRFKAHFSKVTFASHTGRWIIDYAKYRELSAQIQTYSHSDIEREEPAYFPPYRSPAIRQHIITPSAPKSSQQEAKNATSVE